MFEKIKYFLEKLFNLNKFKLPQGISLDERTLFINAQKNQILNGLNLDKKSDSEILKEFKQQGLSQQQAEKKLDAIRKDIERIFDITPINEFGKNYAEYYNDGKNAIQKLLSEKQGQVAGAFYKEGLGEIDLVWGNNKGGLEHIFNKRKSEFLNGLKNKNINEIEKNKLAEEKAIKFINELPRIIKESKLFNKSDDKLEYITPNETLIFGLREYNIFVLTSYKDRNKNNFMLLGINSPCYEVNFTSKSVSEQLKADDVLLQNQQSNPTTKKQISQEQKKQAHLAREAGIKKSLDLLQKKQSKSADTAVSNISSDSIKNETKPKFRKMFQRKDNINNKDKK